MFRDKEALFLETVDYLFDRIKDSEQKIVENPEMDTLQKIHTILGVMPECYQDVDFRQLYQLKRKISGDLSSGGSTARNRLGKRPLPCWNRACRKV